jgi:hypothetical protein
VLGDLGDLGLRDEGALDPLHLRGAGRPEEHVALPSSVSAPPWSRITRESTCRGDRECDPRGNVDLDRPGDDVRRRPLRRQQRWMPTARASGQADDRVLDLGRRDHHQVRELVDHAEDVRERRLARPARGPG